MKTFTESLKPKEVIDERSDLLKILHENLTVLVNDDLTSANVEIDGLDDAEIALQEHIESLKKQWLNETISNISSQIESGKPLKLILENLYDSFENI